ncbi:hypothetical protein [Streptomyces sp. LaBMicrA B280]|uniref:hypothetical protein n=1 Tax=Streptomyces sp. LaBMicrA B280 TaxID=3391001 RepID=UPI003BA4D602
MPAVPAAVVVAEAAVPAVPVAVAPAVVAVVPAAVVVTAPAVAGVREVPRVGGDAVVRTVGGPLLVADDNPVVRAGLTALLTDRAETTVVAQAAAGRAAAPTRAAARTPAAVSLRTEARADTRSPFTRCVVRVGDRSAARPHPATRPPADTGDARAS